MGLGASGACLLSLWEGPIFRSLPYLGSQEPWTPQLDVAMQRGKVPFSPAKDAVGAEKDARPLELDASAYAFLPHRVSDSHSQLD